MAVGQKRVVVVGQPFDDVSPGNRRMRTKAGECLTEGQKMQPCCDNSVSAV